VLVFAPGHRSERYHPASNRWTITPTAPLPSPGADLTGPGGYLTALLPDGRILAAGGAVGAAGCTEKCTSTPVATAYRYDFATNQWVVAAPLAIPRGNALIATLPDGRFFVVGGDQKRRPGTTVTAEIYATTPLPPRCFTATGQCIAGRFLTYWLAYGGLAVNGYPLTGEFTQTLEDGHTYTVQYFERARFEQHPENQPPYDILLGQFGRRILAGVAPPPPPPLTVVNGFGALYNTNAAVRERLGRPTTNERAVPGATQPFERGRMVYLGDTKTIRVLGEWPDRAGSKGDWLRAPDTWKDDHPAGGGPGLQPGLYLPQRGFGKLWRGNYNTVQARLGYATAPTEQALTLSLQFFERGAMLYGATSDGPTIYVLYDYAPDGSSGHYERYAASP
jgi:hypothetical protein